MEVQLNSNWYTASYDSIAKNGLDVEFPIISQKLGEATRESVLQLPTGFQWVSPEFGYEFGEQSALVEYKLHGLAEQYDYSKIDGYNDISKSIIRPVSFMVVHNQERPAAPEFNSSTKTSITVEARENEEYSIDSGEHWQDSPVFENLLPSSNHDIIARMKADESHNASESSRPTLMQTKFYDWVGKPVINGRNEVDAELVCNIDGLETSPSLPREQWGKFYYRWFENGIQVKYGTDNSYYRRELGTKVTVEVFSLVVKSVVMSDETEPGIKGQGYPTFVEINSVNATQINVASGEYWEYSIDGGDTWQDNGQFDNLTPNTVYKVVTRALETATRTASIVSEPKFIVTSKLYWSNTGLTIDGQGVYGETLTANTAQLATVGNIEKSKWGQLKYQWYRDGVPIVGATSRTYRLFNYEIGHNISLSVTADNCQGALYSEQSVFVTKAAGILPNAPHYNGSTATEIFVATNDDEEYSIDGGNTWQRLGNFKNLRPNQDYEIYARKLDSMTHFQSDISAPLRKKTALAQWGGELTIDGPIEYGETLSASLNKLVTEGINKADWGNVYYQWYRDGKAIDNATDSFYKLMIDDINHQITVGITAENVNGAMSAPTENISRAHQQTPAKPELLTKTDTEIIMHSKSGQEYSIDGGETWTNGVFSGLKPNQEYAVIARNVFSNMYLASENSAMQKITTNKATWNGNITIAGNTAYDSILTAEVDGLNTENGVEKADWGNIYYQWYRDGVALPDATEKMYLLGTADVGAKLTVSVSGQNINNTVLSNKTTAITKAVGRIPDAPEVVATTATSVTVTNKLGEEYSIDDGNKWQSNTTFTGLKPNNKYQVIARTAVSNTNLASSVSEATSAVTNKVLWSGQLSVSGQAKFGETLTADISELITTNVAVEDRGPISYQWYRDDSAIAAANGDNYKLSENDIGKLITVKVTAENVDGTKSATTDDLVEKADWVALDATEMPAQNSIFDGAITSTQEISIPVTPGFEYSIDGGKTWNTTGMFDKLNPVTEYAVTARLAETSSNKASRILATYEITTKAHDIALVIGNAPILQYSKESFELKSLIKVATGEKEESVVNDVSIQVNGKAINNLTLRKSGKVTVVFTLKINGQRKVVSRIINVTASKPILKVKQLTGIAAVKYAKGNYDLNNAVSEAHDVVEGNLKAKVKIVKVNGKNIGFLSLKKAGIFKVTYQLQNNDGQVTQIERNVQINADKPKLILKSKTLTLKQSGKQYKLVNVVKTVGDKVDSNSYLNQRLSIVINGKKVTKLSLKKKGLFTIKYSVENSNNQSTIQTINIRVK